MINIIHTQNITRNWNFFFQYRLINSPGTYGSQSTNHNNYRFTSWYQSNNKRYQAFLIMLGSKLQSAESAGIQNNSYLDSASYTNRFTIPTNIGQAQTFGSINNPFGTTISTGTFYTTGFFTLRQQYDIIGLKDSVVTDSIVSPCSIPNSALNKPSIIQPITKHLMTILRTQGIIFITSNFISTPDTMHLSDLWHNLTNDFSLYSFPDSKNSQQFLKAGITFQSMKGPIIRENFPCITFSSMENTGIKPAIKNGMWRPFGNFYMNGYNAGDYNAYLSLKRQISKNLGYLQVGFENVNRTVSMAWTHESSFGFRCTREFSIKKM